MNEKTLQSASGAMTGAPAGDALSGPGPTPVCFVVDDDASIRHFLSLILHGAGIDTEEFPDGQSFRQAVAESPGRPRLSQYRARIRRRHRVRCGARQAGLLRLCPAHEQSRLGRARARQEHRRAAPHANAAGAQEAVRDQRHPQDPAGPQARPSARDGGAHRPRRRPEEQLDRILVPAQDRSAEKATGGRRSFRPRAPSAIRHPDARRLHARRARRQASSRCPNKRSRTHCGPG